MLRPLAIPGLFITGTDTGVGKTLVAGAIARWFRQRRYRVAVSKPVATGCPHRREGLVSEDAEFLAHCADSPHPLDLICPQRFAEPLAPAVAAERSKTPIDWPAIQRSLDLLSTNSQLMIVEGAGGIYVPIDGQITMLDLAVWLKRPAVIVARPGLGTINHSVMTVKLLQQAGVTVAGVVINRYPAESAGPAEESNPRQIEKLAKVPVLCIVPDEPTAGHDLAPGVSAAIEQVDWLALLA